MAASRVFIYLKSFFFCICYIQIYTYVLCTYVCFSLILQGEKGKEF